MAERGIRRPAQKKGPFYTNLIGGATMTVGVEAALAANAIDVAVQLLDQNVKNNLGQRGAVKAYLSDDPNGDGRTATAPDGGAAAGVAGTVIEDINDLSFTLVSNAAGLVNVRLTESGVKTCYLVLVFPDGSIQVSGAITWA